MHDGLQRLVLASRRYRFRRRAERFLSCLTHLATPGAVALLTAAFLSKLLWPPLVYALLLLPVWVLLVAAYAAARPALWDVPGWQADALGDLRSGSRGTFMALGEARGQEWSASLGDTDVSLPVRFPWPQVLRWTALAAAVVAVLLLPDLRPRLLAPPALTPIERTQALVATLKEEDLAEQQYLERAQQVLEEIRQETTTSLRAEDWQALDRLRDDLMKQTAASYQRLQEEKNQLARLQNALAKREPSPDELRESAQKLGEMSPEEAAQACSAAAPADFDAAKLDAFLGKCRSGGSSFTPEELALLRSLAQRSSLSPEQLAQLAKMLTEMDPKELAALCKQQGLAQLTPEQIGKLCSACKAGKGAFSAEDRAALAALLGAAEGECEGKMGFCAGLLGQADLGSRGGVDRGPGPAPLLGAGNTDAGFGEFQAQAFAGPAAEPEVPLGFALTPPQPPSGETGTATAAPGPAVEFGAGNERLTYHSRLLPRHNDVMKKYFSEDTSKEPE